MAKFLDAFKKTLNAVTYRTNAGKALQWLRNSIRELGSPKKSLTAIASPVQNQAIGKMFFFVYDPKWKVELPYYDKFPLVLPIESYGDGFLGLNFHYLPVNLRAHLLDRLYELADSDKISEITRITASYGILVAASRYNAFKPCVKRYLYAHVRSQYLEIRPDAWMTAMYLPVEQFEKAGTSKVWADSRRKIGGE